MSTLDILSIIFASTAIVGLLGGLWTRFAGPRPKGIGAQFIRYVAIAVAVPIGASLLAQGLSIGGIVSIVLGALGFAFAGSLSSDD